MRNHFGPRSGMVSLRLAGAAVLALALALAGSRAASAQGVQVTPNDQKPSPGWTLTPVFVFAQSTDSNVTLAGEGNPQTTDKLAAFSPSVDIGYLGDLTTFTAGYASSANRYFTLNELNTFDQRLHADLKAKVAPHLQLFASESASWMPTTDTVLLAGVPFLRVGSRLQTLQGGVTISLTKHTDLTGAYRFEWVGFDRSNPAAARLIGGYSNGAYGDVRHQLSEHLFIGATYDIRRVLIGGGLQTFDMESGEGTVEYHFSPALFVSGGFGVSRIAGSLPSQASRIGPAWHAGATYKLDRVLAYGTYLRSVVPSYGIGGTIQNQEIDLGASAPIAFRNRLLAGGSFSWRRNDPLVLTAYQLTSRWINLFGGYSVAPWMRLEGFYGRSKQGSPLGNVLRNQLGVQVVVLAPMRFK